ncbi:MAG TPA: response regulator transcription factor [Terriglobia bacterium]|nr:response regulator transcription factor [Terriglobia bacterium]
MKILVAEDNSVTATLMVGVLTRQGYTVVLARNGSEALSLLGSDPDIQGVITDIMMPESSGLDLLRALREHETWRNLPTIVTTVRDDGETVAQAVALGCREYILKPVRPARLIERVTKVFRQENVILMSSSEVISRYSLSLETYRRIAKNFATQVDQAITVLQNWSTNPTNALAVDIIQIMEGATLLGAERLMAALEETFPTAGSSPLNRFQVASLEEELQLVRKALTT